MTDNTTVELHKELLDIAQDFVYRQQVYKLGTRLCNAFFATDTMTMPRPAIEDTTTTRVVKHGGFFFSRNVGILRKLHDTRYHFITFDYIPYDPKINRMITDFDDACEEYARLTAFLTRYIGEALRYDAPVHPINIFYYSLPKDLYNSLYYVLHARTGTTLGKQLNMKSQDYIHQMNQRYAESFKLLDKHLFIGDMLTTS